MQSEAERIAGKLTKAQREAVLFKGLSVRDGICRSPNIATARVLFRKGITERESYVVPFTPLGLEVRRILERKRK